MTRYIIRGNAEMEKEVRTMYKDYKIEYLDPPDSEQMEERRQRRATRKMTRKMTKKARKTIANRDNKYVSKLQYKFCEVINGNQEILERSRIAMEKSTVNGFSNNLFQKSMAKFQ
jgi:guanylate kinase